MSKSFEMGGGVVKLQQELFTLGCSDTSTSLQHHLLLFHSATVATHTTIFTCWSDCIYICIYLYIFVYICIYLYIFVYIFVNIFLVILICDKGAAVQNQSIRCFIETAQTRRNGGC